MTSQKDLTFPLHEHRAMKSPTRANTAFRLHPRPTSQSTVTKALTCGFATFHFLPPTGVGASPTCRPYPSDGRGSGSATRTVTIRYGISARYQ